MSKPFKGMPEVCQKVMIALSKILVPRNDDLVLDGIDDYLLRYGNKMMNEMPKLLRFGLFMGMRVFEWLPFIFGFGLSRFSKLNSRHQAEYIKGWAESRLLPKREFFKTLRAFVMLIVYSNKQIWEYIGYDPEPHLKQRIQMRKDLLAQQEPKSKNGELISDTEEVVKISEFKV